MPGNFKHCFKLQQKEEAAQLEKEKEIADKEALYQARMREEAELLAKQEAYARAAAEPIVIDNTPRPMPPELNQTLETVGEEEEPAAEGGDHGANLLQKLFPSFLTVLFSILTGNEEQKVATSVEPETESQPETEQPPPQGKPLIISLVE